VYVLRDGGSDATTCLTFLPCRSRYAISGERTLEAFYETVHPFASAFMALFGGARLPAASTLSRFLAALPAEPVQALRTLFLEDLLARRLSTEEHAAGLWDRQGNRWLVFDVDGTREAARQRALPQTPDRPPPQRRLRPLCAPGYTGRKRGEVVRTRTTVLQMHTHQWVASFGHPGNGQYREELRRAKAAIQTYLKAHNFPAERTLLRLDGQYGTGAVICDVDDFSYVTRGKDYSILDRADVQARLHLPADQHLLSAESGICHALYDCPDQCLAEGGPLVRIIVATHPAPARKKKKRQVGLTRDGVVYELLLTNLPQNAFTSSDVVSLYLHRGAFETALEDEDEEQDPDRWCSHSAWGELAWQIVAQWTWNLRLELGHQLKPEPLRTTEFAPALPPQNEHVPTRPTSPPASAPASGYAPPATATRLGKLAASPGPTFPFNLMGRFGVPQAISWFRMNGVEKAMAVCGWSIPPAFAIAVRVRCGSNANGAGAKHANRARSASCSIPWRWDRLRCCGGTGIGDTSGRHVSTCIANAWTSRESQPFPPPKPLLLPRSLVPNVRITVCPGRSGWLAMPEPLRLVRLRSNCSVSPKPLRAGLA